MIANSVLMFAAGVLGLAVLLTWLAWRFFPDALGGLRGLATAMRRQAAASWASAPRERIAPVAAAMLFAWGGAVVFNWPFMAQVLDLWIPSGERWYLPYAGSVGAAALVASGILTLLRVGGALYVFHVESRDFGAHFLRPVVLGVLLGFVVFEGVGTYYRSVLSLGPSPAGDAAPFLAGTLGWLGVLLGVGSPLFEIALGPIVLVRCLIPLATNVLGRVPAVVLWTGAGLLHLLLAPFPLPAEQPPAAVRVAVRLRERIGAVQSRVDALEARVHELDGLRTGFDASLTAFEQEVKAFEEREVAPPAHREEMRRVRHELRWTYRRMAVTGRRLAADARRLRRRWRALWREIGRLEGILARREAELSRFAGSQLRPEEGAEAAGEHIAGARDDLARLRQACASIKTVTRPLNPTLEAVAELNQRLRAAFRRLWERTHVPFFNWTGLQLAWLWYRFRVLAGDVAALEHDLPAAARDTDRLQDRADDLAGALAQIEAEVGRYANTSEQRTHDRTQRLARRRAILKEARHLDDHLRRIAAGGRQWRAELRRLDRELRRFAVVLRHVNTRLLDLGFRVQGLLERLRAGSYPQMLAEACSELSEQVDRSLGSCQDLETQGHQLQDQVARLARHAAQGCAYDAARLRVALRAARDRRLGELGPGGDLPVWAFRLAVVAGLVWAGGWLLKPQLPARVLWGWQVVTLALGALALCALAFALYDWVTRRLAEGRRVVA